LGAHTCKKEDRVMKVRWISGAYKLPNAYSSSSKVPSHAMWDSWEGGEDEVEVWS